MLNNRTSFVITISLLTLSALFSSTVTHAFDNPWDTKLPFKHATIEYSITGMEKGTQTTHVRDYGREQVNIKTTKMGMMGMSVSHNTIEIITEDWDYDIDLNENAGMRTPNMNKYFTQEFNKLSSSDKKKVAKNAEDMGVSMAQGFGGEVKKGKVNFLGYDCDSVSAMGVTTYTISGTQLVLRTEASMMGMESITEATAIKTGKPPADAFEVPKGIKIETDTQSEPMMRSYAADMMQWLKNPKNKPMPMPAFAAGMPGSHDTQENTGKRNNPQEMEKAMDALKSIFGGQQQ